MKRRRSRLMISGLACLVLALPLSLLACALPFFSTTITDTIFGEALAANVAPAATYPRPQQARLQSLRVSILPLRWSTRPAPAPWSRRFAWRC